MPRLRQLGTVALGAIDHARIVPRNPRFAYGPFSPICLSGGRLSGMA